MRRFGSSPPKGAGAGQRPLLPAATVRLRSDAELAVLDAICWIGMERCAPGGVHAWQLRRRTSMRRVALHRHLRRLVSVGALGVEGAWGARTHSLTDVGLATLTLIEGELASAHARLQD